MDREKRVRVLELQPRQVLDGQLLKLQTGWTLRFTVAPILGAENVHLFTDFPSKGQTYKRGQLRELQWRFRGREQRWDPDRFIELNLDVAGAFRYVFTLGECGREEDPEGSGYLLINPDLGYSTDSISCQTYVTKLLGQVTEWLPRLEVAYRSGYNMVHFTPIQHLGGSHSSYSIANQLRLDPAYLPQAHVHKEVPVTFTNRSGEQKTLMLDSALLEVRSVLSHLRQQWGILSIVDVVWNHTAYDTPWLAEHPEAYYNLVNSPHLRPAYVFDTTLKQFSAEISDGKWEGSGIYPFIHSEHDIQRLCDCLLSNVLPKAKLWEFFSVDVEAIVKEFRTSVYRLNGGEHPRPEGKQLTIIQDSLYRRLGSTVDASLTMELFNIHCPGVVCFEERIEWCCSQLREELVRLNDAVHSQVHRQLEHAVHNLVLGIRYQFLESHGPHREYITRNKPLFPQYFFVVGGGAELTWEEVESSKGQTVAAHNGWVMNADPLKNFAAEGSQVYFQRELIVWEDSVKLRYGGRPFDSPWLWAHMKRYTQAMAWLFDGFRLDNCHNTPIDVAERLLDSAREVNPNLYLVAELFTDSEERDNYFVNRLGINSLIREAMFAPVPRELGRLVYKYGGEPVASFFSSSTLIPSVAHAMFMDATHDNEPGHILSRSVQDALPNTALTAIASCASGSCRGYDELVPHRVHIVEETRLYCSWSEDIPSCAGQISEGAGIIAATALLNQLHHTLAQQGFNQIYVDQVTEEIVAVTRHSPATHRSYIMMAHTAFRPPPPEATPTEDAPNTHWSGVPPLTVPGRIVEVYMEARLVQRSPAPPTFSHDPGYINGLASHKLELSSHIPIAQSRICHLAQDQEVVFTNFPPGSVIVFEVDLLPEACHAVQLIRSFLSKESSNSEGCELWKKLLSIAPTLTLTDLNYALYRCDSEERDDGQGGGVYVVPGVGAMVYCGLQGTISMLKSIRSSNDLGHPLCDNLRAGDWLMGYTVNRLKLQPGTNKIADVLAVIFQHLSSIPRYLIPCYFDAVVSRVYDELVQVALNKMSKFVQEGSSLVKSLALGSVQLHGECRSASLPPPLPEQQISGSLAAGLPHFATGFMRCWGRDTFIALRGLLLVTGRHDNARDALLAFAACMRHGLIPNLLNSGSSPRYNCRDAVWWWLQSLQEYCQLVPHGTDILQVPIRKLFFSDEADHDPAHSNRMTVAELVQEALQRHAGGINFRERGAGPNLDKDMTPPGFNVSVAVDAATGFVCGGNQWNCGTWMDKVGESSLAGNHGTPATPRDGSAVELVGLCYSTISWLDRLHRQGLYPYGGVTMSSDHKTVLISFSEWRTLIKDNFERSFWIPRSDEAREADEAGYVHRSAIYKDTVGSHYRYTDYQLRPNFPIAMVVAPDLFTSDNAWAALQQVEKLLKGPMGMKTLDPGDWQHDGFYINSFDSSNYKTARGFNYHQGPEWLWVTGYYLRACLLMAQRCEGVSVDEMMTSIHVALSKHAKALRESPWNGLPELTNSGGVECADSCPVQAWSMSCLLDILYDLAQLNQ